MADADLMHEFVTESRDMLDEVEPELIELQQASDLTGGVDPEILNNIFRLFHSMKGSAGFLQLNSIAGVTHEAETLLDLFRKGKLEMTGGHTDLLCQALDLMRGLLDTVEATLGDAGHEGPCRDMVARLQAAIAGESGDAAPAEVEAAAPASPPAIAAEKPAPAPGEVKPNPAIGAGGIAAAMEMEITPEMVKRFVTESAELLDDCENLLMQIESDPEHSDEEMREAFRAMHSFKGNCGFFGLQDLGGVSHKFEEVLQGMQEGGVERNSNNIGMLLKVIDVLHEGVVDISEGGKGEIEGAEVFMQLLQETLPVQTPQPAAATTPPAAEPASREQPAEAAAASSAPAEPAPAGQPEVSAPQASGPHILAVDDEEGLRTVVTVMLGNNGYRVTTAENGQDALQKLATAQCNDVQMIISDIAMPVMDGLDFIKALKQNDPLAPVMVLTGHGDRDMLVKFIELGTEEFLDKPFNEETLLKKVVATLEKGKKKKAPAATELPPKREKKALARQDIRVDLAKLDSLINLIGELVIAESMVTRNPDLCDVEFESFERSSHHLHRITGDLQDIAMSVRMIPLSATFRKMVRLVHDLSRKIGKKVTLNLIGEDTEVDKTVIEQIGDPLVHIVRNSIDHGIEKPEVRLAAGKPEVGTVTIEARHEGGEVWILIVDDGGGMNREKILARAMDRGLFTGNPDDLKDEEVFRFVFEPGFSTAETVSDVSGRGVGMDVVKRNIEKLRGKVNVHSKLGQGSTVILRIPLTLAIIDGMLIRVGSQCYTLPTLAIRESFRPTGEELTVNPDGQEVVRVREELIPVVRLHEAYNIKHDFRQLHDGILIIVEAGHESVCLFVDEILGQQEIVIKGLSDYLGKVRGVSGCTILGNGEISLIIDVVSLIDHVKSLALAES